MQTQTYTHKPEQVRAIRMPAYEDYQALDAEAREAFWDELEKLGFQVRPKLLFHENHYDITGRNALRVQSGDWIVKDHTGLRIVEDGQFAQDYEPAVED